MSVIWSPQAVEDVAFAVDYLVRQDAIERASRLIERLTSVVEKLANEPINGPEHVLSNGERVRGWPCPPFRL